MLRGTATWALNVGDLIEPTQIVITGPDGSAIFQIADGSTVEVFPNSRFVFRETMGDWRDLLRVFMGRVRVEIQHLGGQPNPNKVRTATAVISVRGTIFDVEVEDSDGTTLVAVEEGRVQVQHVLQPGAPKILNPGEWVEVFWNQPLAVRKTDYGVFAQRLMNLVKDTLYEALLHSHTGAVGTPVGTSAGGTGADSNGGGKTTGSGGTTSGGTSNGGTTTGGSSTPPPPPAPPAPPPH